jgi:hypothetical protein
MYDMARHLLRGVGRPSGPIDFDNYAVDDIGRGYVFTVYPEIADFYGIPGGYLFKTSHYNLSKNLGRFWNLRGYVQDCYRIYGRHKPDQLVSDRVQGWFDDSATAEFLRDFAGRPRGRVGTRPNSEQP